MRRIITFIAIFSIFLGVFILLISCSAADSISASTQGQAAEQEQATQALQQQAQETPSPEVTPTSQSTPTSPYDVRATELYIEAIKADTENKIADTNNKILAITKEAADAANRLALEESERLDADLAARATVAIAKAEAAKIEAGAKATQQWEDLEIRRKQADTDAAWAQVGNVLAWGFITLLGAIVFYLIARGIITTIYRARATYYPNLDEEADDGSLADDLANYHPEQLQVASGGHASIQVMIEDWTGIATIEQLKAIARGIQAGVSLAVQNWYGQTSWEQPPVFSRGQFENFIEAITRKGIGPDRRILAYSINGHAVLKQTGKDYFKQIQELYGD